MGKTRGDGYVCHPYQQDYGGPHSRVYLVIHPLLWRCLALAFTPLRGRMVLLTISLMTSATFMTSAVLTWGRSSPQKPLTGSSVILDVIQIEMHGAEVETVAHLSVTKHLF